MKNKKYTVSVGIPALNEGANITYLLRSLLAQKNRGFKLKEILVISDGSTDDTVRFARSINDKRIVVINGSKRLGKSARLQTILRRSSSDVLFLMDADIAITDPFLFAKVLWKTNIQKAGIVSVNASPLPADTQFEKIVEVGVNVMKDIRKHWRAGENYLPFKGCFLAMHRDLIKKTTMPAEVVSNDSYLYFNALAKGFTPKYIDDTFVYYRSPRKFEDHIKQSSRHVGSKDEMAKYFKLDWKREYAIPAQAFILSLFKAFIKQPVLLPAYLGVSAYGRFRKQTNVTALWSVAVTTKEVLPYG